jgi:fructose-bisphosphate aldolase class II
LPLAENLRIAAELLRAANEADVLLELEIGTVGGEEDGLDHERVEQERLYTTPDDALAVARTLGLGEHGRYLLAAAFGNVHGRYAPGNVLLRPELLAELQNAVVGTRGFDFVFHGGSGSTAIEIQRAVANGVVKMNVDTDLQYAFTKAVALHVREHGDSLAVGTGGAVNKATFDPRAWGRKAEAAMAASVVEACRTLGSAARSLYAG